MDAHPPQGFSKGASPSGNLMKDGERIGDCDFYEVFVTSGR
jgi:hypothetical protein